MRGLDVPNFITQPLTFERLWRDGTSHVWIEENPTPYNTDYAVYQLQNTDNTVQNFFKCAATEKLSWLIGSQQYKTECSPDNQRLGSFDDIDFAAKLPEREIIRIEVWSTRWENVCFHKLWHMGAHEGWIVIFA